MILTVTLNAAVDKRYEVENLRVSQVNRVKKTTCTAGGKGLNVARIITQAGEKAVATGFAGGYTGMLIEALARKEGITADFVSIPEESRTCINIFDTAAGSQTEFLEEGPEVSKGSAAGMKEKYEALLKETEVVTISGSVPRGITVELYCFMIQRAREKGIPVLLDTSGTLLQESIQAKPLLIKPNQDEIFQLTGRKMEREEDLLRAGMQLVKQGIRYVVISLGGDGALLFSENGVWKSIIPRVETVNTVGCGDAMLAGLAMAIRRGLAEEELLHTAGAIATASALCRETGYFRKADYEVIYPQVRIKKQEAKA